MCPTEMLFDEGTEPCLRLLPIETRKDKKSVSQYKREPVNWTVKPLNIESVDEMTIALKELVATQRVSVAEANTLGFGVNADSPDVKDGMVDVPTWRHAMINYPHPLLKRGLVVLDTPGLNALGSEPELTLRMLPAAHAVIFVLAADTGVTHSDLQIWKNHVCVATHMTDGSRFAALNKIDTLWDELLTGDQIRANIKKQVAETARLLEMNTSNVFPVSAAKGLLGKIREDEKLLISTGLPHLERQVSQRIVSAKRDILREKVVGDIGGMVEGSRQIISTRLDKRHEEIAELEALQGKGQDVLKTSIERLQKQKSMFEAEVDSFRVSRRMLSDEIKALMEMIALKRFDILFADTRKSMRGSLTTSGLKTSMSSLFKEMNQTLDRVQKQSEKVRGLVEKSYDKFHSDHGLPKVSPAKFHVTRHTRKLAKLVAEAEAFRDSSEMLVTEQGSLIQKFFDTMVSRMRSIIKEANSAAQNWATAVLNPIRDQLREHKSVINSRLENLEALRNSQLDLKSKMQSLDADIESLTEELKSLDKVLAMITVKEEDAKPKAKPAVSKSQKAAS